MSIPLRIGVLKLADSAPVIMGRQKGIFARYGLDVETVVSPSWANIADGLAWSRLDSAVIFAPLAIMTALGRRGHDTDLYPLGRISRGGNTIMLRGVNPIDGPWRAEEQGRKAFDIWQTTIGRKPRIAVVHMYSTHLLILRRFLKMLGINMESQIELLVMPPADMIHAFAENAIDGGCVGPPWGTEAERTGLAFRVGGSSTVLPDHLEKILVASGKLRASADTARNVYLAIQDSLDFCKNPVHRMEIAQKLSRSVASGGLGLPMEATYTILPGGNASETITFSGGSLVCSDLEWIMSDMTDLGWLEATQQQALERWMIPTSMEPA